MVKLIKKELCKLGSMSISHLIPFLQGEKYNFLIAFSTTKEN